MYLRLALLLLLALPTLSFSATLFADSRASLMSAIAASAPGDFITIRKGTYTDLGTIIIAATKDGTGALASQRVTLQGETAGGVILQGNGALNLVVRSRFWTIKNLEFRNQTGPFDSYEGNASGTGGLLNYDGAQDIVTENITMRNIGGPGVVVPIMEWQGTRVTRRLTFSNFLVDVYKPSDKGAFGYMYGGENRGFVRDITWRGKFLNRTCNTTQRFCYWLKFGNSPASANYDSGLVVENSEFQFDTPGSFGQDIFHFKGRGITVRSSFFHFVGALTFRQGDNHVITRNAFHNPNTTRQDTQLRVYASGHIITNNSCLSTIASRKCMGLGKGTVERVGQGPAGPDYDVFINSVIAHNSCSGFRDACFTMMDNDTGQNDGPTTLFPSGLTFRNNAVTQSTGSMFDGTNCATRFTSISHNARSGAATAGCMATGTNNVVAASLGWAPNTISPLTGSVLIDAGVDVVGYPETNFDMFGRVRDNEPDIGSVEFAGAVTPPPDAAKIACDNMFGSATDYLLCDWTSQSCSFNVATSGTSCNAVCASFGKACAGAIDNWQNSCNPIEGSNHNCSSVAGDEICTCETNNAPPPPVTNTRYVDSSCVTQGNGTTATCGANGPWLSIDYAMMTAQCSGMTPGGILSVKGMTSVPTAGNWYGATSYSPVAIVPAPGCSGIIVQNASGTHVVGDGTIDIKAGPWVHIGGNVYECQGTACGTAANFPMTAWVKVGATEHQLDLIQTVRTCQSTLAAGKMTYNPAGKRVCVHLPDNSNPASATYVRIPFNNAAFQLHLGTSNGITFRSNPSGGSFTLTRYRDRIFEVGPSTNQNITINGLELSWTQNRCLTADWGIGSGSFTFVNNKIHHCGQDGIALVGATGVSTIENNEIHDIGMAPDFEQCAGVGAGCHFSFNNSPSAIRVNNCVADGATQRNSISNNEIYNVGGGRAGIGYGIHLQDCTYFNKIDANIIHNSTASPSGVRAVQLSGFADGQYHDENIITNTRCEDVDICLATTYTPWSAEEELQQFADQTGRINYFLGATCYNPNTHCWVQETGGSVGGELSFRNNIAAKDDGYAMLMNVGTPTFWKNTFRRNGFECSHSSCVNQVIATFDGVTYKRDGECTGTDCIANISTSGGNLYGIFCVQPDTLEVVRGSDAINIGENLPLLTRDAFGTSRPLGASTDSGAHEFSGAGSIVSLTQGSYRFYDRFMVDGMRPISAENGTVRLHPKSQFTLRIGAWGNPDSDKETVFLALYVQHCDPTCGAYEPITNNCTTNAACLIDNPHYETGRPIANDLSLSGRTFLTTSHFIEGGGQDEKEGYLIGASEQIEIEYSIKMGAVAQGDVVNFRLYDDDGNPLNSYTVTPSVPLGPVWGTMHFNR